MRRARKSLTLHVLPRRVLFWGLQIQSESAFSPSDSCSARQEFYSTTINCDSCKSNINDRVEHSKLEDDLVVTHVDDIARTSLAISTEQGILPQKTLGIE